MSSIWICEDKSAENPFFLKEQSINLYSLEELCYYLYQNAEVIEDTFFDERLLQWLEKELGLCELCQKLREGMEQEKAGLWCMEVLLWESGYYSREELEKKQRTISQMMEADPKERKKMRADRMLRDGKYKRALQEYQQLLPEAMDKVLESRIWHNMGTAYAKQFLFARAAECYEKAYTTGRMEESRQQYLLACAYAEGEKAENAQNAERDSRLQQVKEQEGFVRYKEEVYHKLEQLAKEYKRSE